MGPTESKVVASVGSESVVLLVVLCLTSRRAPRESEVVVAIVPESVVVLVVCGPGGSGSEGARGTGRGSSRVGRGCSPGGSFQKKLVVWPPLFSA